MKTIKTHSTEETAQWAKQWSKKLHGGDVVALVGDLGAGKTLVSQVIGHSLGVKEAMSSPSYTIINEYDLSGSIRKIYHIDTYRLSDSQELIDIGIEEILNDKKSLVIIEWPEKIKEILPKTAKWVYIKEIPGQENGRELTIQE